MRKGKRQTTAEELEAATEATKALTELFVAMTPALQEVGKAIDTICTAIKEFDECDNKKASNNT